MLNVKNIIPVEEEKVDADVQEVVEERKKFPEDGRCIDRQI